MKSALCGKGIPGGAAHATGRDSEEQDVSVKLEFQIKSEFFLV